MKAIIRHLIEETYQREAASTLLEEGLAKFDRPGHTKEVSQLLYCHEGRHSAHYYVFGTLLKQLDEQAGLAILRALAELQITDPTHPQYGGFRWYREETQINDTNAAFFIIMPLITLQLSHPEVISVSQLQVLKEMLGMK